MAQEDISAVLSLDSCRALAVRNNKELRMAGERLRAAHAESVTAQVDLRLADVYMRKAVGAAPSGSPKGE